MSEIISAISAAIAWDRRRGYLMPNKVRDPLLAILSTTRAEEIATRAEKAERERDAAMAESVARGKMLVRTRDRLINARDGLDDAGDLVSFGSTNDADDFRDAVQELDDFKWSLILAESDEPDLIEQCRRANARADAAEAELAAMRRDRERLDFLDHCNAMLNETSGTRYGWELILNHNVTRLMSGRLAIDLNDSAAGASALQSCRDAIDARMKSLSEGRSDG